MEGLIQNGTEFASMVAASLVSADFTLFDVGCSGGIDPAWRCFGEKLVAYGFDPNREECARLSRLETGRRVQYVAGFVGLPPDHEFLRRRGQRSCWSRNPWGRLSAHRSIDIRKRRVPEMSGEQLRDMNLWAETNLADPAAPLILSDFAKANSINDVDFVKIDVDGEDFAILNSIADELAAWKVLGVCLEVNYFGSENDTDHTFHNTDRFMRRHGFDLFNLSVRRYSHAALPSKYTWYNPAQTITGRPLQGDAIYLRDVCLEGGEPFAEQLDPPKLLKLAAIASLAQVPDTACEILLRFRERLAAAMDIDHALDALARQGQAALGLAPPLSYREYMEAFAADAPSFYTSLDCPRADHTKPLDTSEPDAQLTALRQRHDADAARISDLEAQVGSLRAQAQADAAGIRDLEAHVAALLSSTSWRVTAPLRALASRLRGRRRHRISTHA